jgi:hypothetical protein
VPKHVPLAYAATVSSLCVPGGEQTDAEGHRSNPSRETATTIIAGEPWLVAAHLVYTLAWLLVLVGLPGLYAAHRWGSGRLGLTGFLTAFSGTYLIAVTGNFGFLAPVMPRARQHCWNPLINICPL